MEEPLVSIILSNYNGLKHLKECFDSLTNLNYNNFEIIFIDNNSHDKSVEFVKDNYPYVKVIENKRDYGFSRANNIAATHANGQYLAFLNIDTSVDTNWLSELVKVGNSLKEIGIVVSKQYYYHDRELINYAGGGSDRYGKSYHLGLDQKDSRLFNIKRNTFYACFAGALMKSKLYRKIGLFDSLYYGYCEDYDLSWRAWLAGYTVVYSPKSIIYHKVGQIIGGPSPKKLFLSEKNRLRTLLKNYELKTLIKVLPIYYGKRIGLILKKTIHFDKSFLPDLYIYLKAFFWNIFHFKSLLKNRKFIQSIRTRDDESILRLMSKSINLAQD